MRGDLDGASNPLGYGRVFLCLIAAPDSNSRELEKKGTCPFRYHFPSLITVSPPRRDKTLPYTVKLTRTDDAYHFVGRNAAGREAHFDTGPEEGGSGAAPGPMQTVAMALGACSAIDVVSILKKSRQEITKFDIDVEYQRAEGEIPAVFTKVHVHYLLEGDLEPEKVQRAVKLSIEKYCSVSKMLGKTAAISHSFSLNGDRYE